MARYSYIPPEYKTNTNNMSTTTHPTTAAGTQLNYNDAAKNRALDYSAQPTSKSVSNLPLYWSSPSPWELEVAMAAAKAKAKPKPKPKPLLFASQSPWEYEVAMLVSEPKPKPVPEPKPKTKPYTSKFREVGTDDLTEPCKADYRAKVELDYRFEFESEQKKGGKMAQAVKDLYKGFQAGAGKK
jgi:hypothetical protein